MKPPYFARYIPSPMLAPYIECYWILRVPAGQKVPPQRMPADSRVELMFSFASPSRRRATDSDCYVQAHSFIMGGRGQGYLLEHEAAPTYMAVRFKPGGLGAFTRLPMIEITDVYLELNTLWSGGIVRDLEEQLAEASSPEQAILMLERTLLRYLNPPDHLSRLMYAAVQLESSLPLPMPLLADSINISQKHFERLFARYIGFRPGLYMRIARFQKALYLAMAQPTVLSYLAASVGYYDQAHFNRDFKHFSGIAPGQFFAAQHEFVQLATPLEVVDFIQDEAV